MSARNNTTLDAESWWAAQAKWLLFGVVLGAAPILSTAIWRYMGRESDLWSPALDHGQLLIGAVGILGGSVARLLRRRLSDPSMVLLGTGVVLAIMGSLVFARIVVLPDVGLTERVIQVSVLWWLFAVLLGSLSVQLTRD